MTEPTDPDKKGDNADAAAAPLETAATAETNEPDARSDFEEVLALDRRLGDFLMALGFFTRLPVPIDEETARRPLADAAWAFPIIGVIVGAAGGIIAAFAGELPPLAAGLLAVGTMTALTGALHEDGLADCADGLWSGADAEDRLRIMRDSRIGAFGVIALVIFIGLKAAAIAQLLSVGGGWPAALAIIAAAAASRGLLPIAMSTLPLAGDSGRAAEAGKPDTQDMIAGAGLALLIALLTVGFAASAAGLIVGTALGAGFGVLAVKRIDGYNGDVLGAQQQILETAILLAAAAAA